MIEGKLIVYRKKRLFESRYSVGIYIDNEFVVNTINNNVQELALKPGTYSLMVKQGFRYGTKTIDIKKGKVIRVEFSATPYIYFTGLLLLLSWVTMKTDNGDTGLLLFFIWLLVFLYVAIVKRKSYFGIKKISEEEHWLDEVKV